MPLSLQRLAGIALLLATACGAYAASNEELAGEVRDTERAFAKTMADRDHAAFTRFLSEEAVFFTGPLPLHGKEAVAARWKRFYEAPAAPFSWEPERVEVLPSGALAMSSGPVRDPSGKQIGTFTSVWRKEGKAGWKIIFDKGDQVCECPRPAE
jgi:ketosteroid isomerase-like protein